MLSWVTQMQGLFLYQQLSEDLTKYAMLEAMTKMIE